MKIVITPDSFKENLTSLEVATAIEKGIKRVLPDARCIKVPMADRFGLRFEVALAHDFKSGDLPSSTTLGLFGGFSFYTR